MSQSDRLYIFQKKHDKNVKYVFKFVNKGEKIVYTIHEKIRLVATTERRKHMESIYSVANYFLSKEPMTHKKLQKMCYFAQAWHMANYDSPLVPNRFEAWVHGRFLPICIVSIGDGDGKLSRNARKKFFLKMNRYRSFWIKYMKCMVDMMRINWRVSPMQRNLGREHEMVVL